MNIWDDVIWSCKILYFTLNFCSTNLASIVLNLVAQSCPTLCDPMDCSLPGSFVHEDSLGKNSGVGCHALLQGTFPTQGSNPGLLHCRKILYHLRDHQPSPQMDKDELIYQHTSLNPREKEDLSSHLITQNSYFDKRVTRIQMSAFYWPPPREAPSFHLQDGWWWELRNNGNVLCATELYS